MNKSLDFGKSELVFHYSAKTVPGLLLGQHEEIALTTANNNGGVVAFRRLDEVPKEAEYDSRLIHSKTVCEVGFFSDSREDLEGLKITGGVLKEVGLDSGFNIALYPSKFKYQLTSTQLGDKLGDSLSPAPFMDVCNRVRLETVLEGLYENLIIPTRPGDYF